MRFLTVINGIKCLLFQSKICLTLNESQCTDIRCTKSKLKSKETEHTSDGESSLHNPPLIYSILNKSDESSLISNSSSISKADLVSFKKRKKFLSFINRLSTREGSVRFKSPTTKTDLKERSFDY